MRISNEVVYRVHVYLSRDELNALQDELEELRDETQWSPRFWHVEPDVNREPLAHRGEYGLNNWHVKLETSNEDDHKRLLAWLLLWDPR